MNSSTKTITMKADGWFLQLLTLLFIGLKLTGYIDWSWWWVLSPVWIPASIGVTLLLIASLLKAFPGRG